MPAPDTINSAQLSRLIGTADAPALIDVRTDDERSHQPHLLPGSVPRDYRAVAEWGEAYRGLNVGIICHDGGKLSQGVAAWLRQSAIRAEYLEGGYLAWAKAEGTLLNPRHLPPRDEKGRTVWVTRSRPKIDRIACPWLIRRFIDPHAVFLFVALSEVAGVAERFNATPFDLEGVFWGHRGEDCTFDIMLKEFELSSPALDRLATIVRGADTARFDLAPESSGLLAASLGLSRMYRDDLAQLEAAMGLYDAFYRWARDASTETHI